MRTLTICGTDIARFAIVTKPNPDPAETTAAEFLQSVIARSVGVTLPITHAVPEHGIMIGTREASPDVKWDGFRITADDRHLYLDGNIPRGTLYAAYDFAEKYLGYRYFAADCEVIPTEGEAAVPAGLDRVDNPVFEMRRCSWVEYGKPDFSAHMRSNCLDTTEQGIYGGNVAGIDFSCHTFDKFCPSDVYFEEHPEYFSYVIDEETGEGKRIPGGNTHNKVCGQLCLTNPDVLRIVTENVLKELRTRPDARTIDISQNDYNYYCECENCTRAAKEDGQAGIMVRFINAVAEEVEKEFPNVLVQTFAYAYSVKPPKHIKARHNVLIRYCTIDMCFRHAINDPHCERNAKDLYAELAGWQEAAEHLSVWDYITNYRCYITPFPNLISLYENAKFFADCHAIHLYESDDSEGGNRAGGVYGDLRAYLVGKLLWNPYITPEAYEGLICDFLRAYYGEGWEHIRRYIDIEHETTDDQVIGCFAHVDIVHSKHPSRELLEWYNGEYEPKPYQPANPDSVLRNLCTRIDEVKALFDAAYAKAGTDTERMHVDRSRMAIDYLDLYCTKHDKGTMTREECAEYEARCTEFLRKKEMYDLCYNIWTVRYHKR